MKAHVKSPIARFLMTRVAAGMVSIFLVSVLIFLGLALLPGDTATALLGQDATPEAIAGLREKLGLDQPFHLQYLHWLANALTGNLGTSLSNGQPVAGLIGPRLVNSLTLAGFAAVLVLPLGIALGLFAAMNRGKARDSVVSLTSAAFLSMPSFLIGYLLVAILAVHFPLFPALSVLRSHAPLSAWFAALALPILTLVLVAQAHLLKLTRAAVLSVMGSDYVLMAQIKGVAHTRIFTRHALPNALSPIVSICMMTIAYLIVDVVVIETVFNYPGMGKLMVEAVTTRNIPVVQACGVLFAIIFTVFNLAADFLSMMVNPRQRLPRMGA